MELIMDAIRGVRARRAEMNVPPSKKAQLTVSTLERAVFEQGIPFLKRLAYASDVTVEGVTDAGSDDAMTAQGMVTVTTHAARLFMPLAELVDLEKEKARIEKELKKNRAELDKLEAKLGNPGFVNKAPAHVVEAEQDGLKSSGPSWPNWRNPPLPWRKQDKNGEMPPPSSAGGIFRAFLLLFVTHL